LVGGVSRFFYQILGLKYQISIHRQTKIGYGLRIVHNGPIVINVSATIGDNVDIYQYTTIGSMFLKAAQIGNNVYIGPSVCIVEDVKIGDGVTIGAGSVIVKDVEVGVKEGLHDAVTYEVIVDRREAIHKAIGEATTGDVVIIAGKGHEDYQILKDETIHFDDREEARAALKEI